MYISVQVVRVEPNGLLLDIGAAKAQRALRIPSNMVIFHGDTKRFCCLVIFLGFYLVMGIDQHIFLGFFLGIFFGIHITNKHEIWV